MNEWVEQWGRDCNQNGIPDECDLKPANAEFVRTELFAPGALLRGLALADLDGDGLVDVIAEGMGFSIYFNKGGGVLEPPVSRLVPGAFPGTLRASDFDGDGDVDLVIANAAPEGRCTGPRGDRVSIFENRGARIFAAPVEFETGVEPQAIEAVDLDGDGDTDLATADHGTGVERRGGVSLLKNRGGGVFDPPEHLDAGISPAGIAVADIDGDGALDIVAVYNNSSEYLNVFRGQGGSEFGFPEVLAVAPHLNWILAGDMDRDGDVDLIVNDSSQPPYVPVERLIVLLNEGGGKSWGFLEVETPTATAVPADLDGDGFVDLVTGNLQVLRNLGTSFAEPMKYRAFRDVVQALAAADMDRDGDVDVVAAGFQAMAVVLNDGGKLRAPAVLLDAAVAGGLAADFNGDGHMDMATRSQHEVIILRNAGGGRFPPEEYRIVPGIESGGTLAAGDVDLDGDVDLLVAPLGRNEVRVYRNPGDGSFGPVFEVILLGNRGVESEQSICLADLDADGDVDIASAGPFKVSLFINRGDGTFEKGMVLLVGSNPFSVAAGDLDGDGDVDLVTGNSRFSPPELGNISILVNRGGGAFLTPGEEIQAMTSGDLDGDGRMDHAVVHGPMCVAFRCQRRLSAVLNREEGLHKVLLDSTAVLSEGSHPILAAGDLDGDGDVDLAAGLSSCRGDCRHIVVLFLNDGAGGFSSRRLAEAQLGLAGSMAAADLEGDGDLDLITDAVSIFRNRGGAVFEDPIVHPHMCCGLAVGDLDSDGDLDLITTEGILRNLGGTFSGPTMHTRKLGTIGGLVDVDGDGHLDLLASIWDIALYLNDGLGHLQAVARLPALDGRVSVLEIGDLNGDGKMDILSGSEEGFTTYFNLVPVPIVPAEARDLDANGLMDECEPPRFLRGDSTGEGVVDIADAIHILLYLFAGGAEPGCKEAANTDSDAEIDVEDALFLLRYLFGSSPGSVETWSRFAAPFLLQPDGCRGATPPGPPPGSPLVASRPTPPGRPHTCPREEALASLG